MFTTLLRNSRRWLLATVAAFVVSLGALPSVSAQDPNQNDVEQAEQKGVQVMTRGPIHEGFGQPVNFNPKPGMIVEKAPPANVEELPPDEKPEGENVAWVAGYWAFDDEKKDFMWVSGFWRNMPPGRKWMAGYWNNNNGQHQWVSGYWVAAEAQEQEFLPQPDPTLEQGPNVDQPSSEHTWVPGHWVYVGARYQWRPGYYVAFRPGWVWSPATYYWTPAGYVFVDGYWDVSLRRRGVIFAPCYMDYNVCYTPGFVYRPRVIIDCDIVTSHYFCRPTYGHYYFGDYYATNYVSIGITPWFNVSFGRTGFYCPDYSYYDCHYRRYNPGWAVSLRTDFTYRQTNVNFRPARTFVQQNNTTIINNNTTIINNNKTVINNNNVVLGKTLKAASLASAKDPNAAMKFEKINQSQIQTLNSQVASARKISTERANLEKKVLTNPNPGGNNKDGTPAPPRKINLANSSVVSKINANPEGTQTIKNIKPDLIPPPNPERTRGKMTTGTGTGTGATGGSSSTGTGAAGGTTGGSTAGGKTPVGATGGKMPAGMTGGSSSTGATGGTTGGSAAGGKTPVGATGGKMPAGMTGGSSSTGTGTGATGGSSATGKPPVGATGGKMPAGMVGGSSSTGTGSGTTGGSSATGKPPVGATGGSTGSGGKLPSGFTGGTSGGSGGSSKSGSGGTGSGATGAGTGGKPPPFNPGTGGSSGSGTSGKGSGTPPKTPPKENGKNG